jgi:hypothetical protein
MNQHLIVFGVSTTNTSATDIISIQHHRKQFYFRKRIFLYLKRPELIIQV